MMRRWWAAALLLGGVGLVALIVWDGQWFHWLSGQQRSWHRALATALRSVTGVTGLSAAAGLIGISFVYGCLHAAGPGHGKAVIATWLLTHPSRLVRGVGLAVASALMQGITALALVGGVLLLADLLPNASNETAIGWSERVSHLMLIGIGGVLLWRGIGWRSHTHHHHHHHHHDHGAECGCSHSPNADQISRAEDPRTMIAILLAVGMRPCTGAILVLALANVLGLVWAGVVSVLAMSVGTALTVALLAILTVKSRDWLIRVFPGSDHTQDHWERLARMAGGGVLLLLGLSLLLASFGDAHPLGMI